LPDNLITLATNFKYNKGNDIETNVTLFANSITITQKQIKNVYNATKQQSESQVWIDQRKGRITASKFYQVYTRMNTVQNNKNEI